MAKSNSSPPPPPTPKQFSGLDEIDRGLKKLSRRLDELRALDPNNVDDPRIEAAGDNLRTAILEIFGANSPEYLRHFHFTMYQGPLFLGGTPRAAQVRAYTRGIAEAVGVAENLIARLREKREEFETQPRAVARVAFEGRSLNADVAAAAADLFRDGHYAEAVFGAAKTLVDLVRRRSGCEGRDGADLMRFVFSKSSPVLAFNARRDDSDLNEQEGMMHLYEGAVQAVRNVRGHRVAVRDEAKRALQYLELLGLLADRLDETSKLS
jgi:uncharacterized protein (TIGR02391 family)